MNTLDWILAAIFVGLFGFAGYMIQPTFGWAVAAALAVFLIYRAKVRRDRIKNLEENRPPK